MSSESRLMQSGFMVCFQCILHGFAWHIALCRKCQKLRIHAFKCLYTFTSSTAHLAVLGPIYLITDSLHGFMHQGHQVQLTSCPRSYIPDNRFTAWFHAPGTASTAHLAVLGPIYLITDSLHGFMHQGQQIIS